MTALHNYPDGQVDISAANLYNYLNDCIISEKFPMYIISTHRLFIIKS